MRRLAGKSCGGAGLFVDFGTEHFIIPVAVRAHDARLSACVRSHGVPSFPDPDSGGNLPAGAKQIASSNPHYAAAQTACGNLLPNGALPSAGEPTQTALLKMERDALNFGRCMRSHGVSNWPDYTRGGIPIFDLHATNIDPNSPQIVTTQGRCKSLLHLSHSPPTSG
jgi:hypothetical protein